MKKRFFQPVWKFEEIEKQLTSLEENGWRLDKIKGFRCFEFVKSNPKTVRYFLTYTLTREKLNMNLIENTLVQNFNANEISGTLLDGLGGTSVFRITKQEELMSNLTTEILLYNIIFSKKLFLESFFSLFCSHH